MDALRSSSVFAPSSGFQSDKSKKLAATAFSDKIAFYYLADTCTENQRLMFTKYLAYCGTNTSDGIVKWKTWVATWACAITPAFSTSVPVTIFRRTEVPAQALAELVGAMDNLQRAQDREDRAEVDAAGEAIKNLTLFPLLPTIPVEIDFGLGNGEWIGKVALCYYAIVIFMAGKRISGDDHSQISIQRPKAVRGKAHIPDSLDFLEGGLRMSDHSHLAINNAWSEMGQLRAIAFTEYAHFDSADADLAKDIIWTSMHLLRYSNMSHALITYNFLNAYPWAVEVPALKTSIAIYMSSLRTASTLDQKMFPFLKLIYGDRSGLFPRKEMEPLIACATSAQQETAATLSDFYTSAAFNPVVDAFNAERARRENIRDLGLQKKEKDLADYFEADVQDTEEQGDQQNLAE